ncbi:MAG: YfiR family protein [Desulfobacterales bacterium]|nr:YfiR family protein [Desulfobacterales bacterium]
MNMRFIIIIIIFCTGIPADLSCQILEYDEYTVKAVFLERVTRFIEWPPDKKVDDISKPFVIAVIGKNPFGSKLDNIYSKRKIRDKKVKVIYISKINQIADSHILFIPVSEKKRLQSIISYSKEKHVLTIGDSNGFAEKGVLFNFYTASNQIKFEINEKAVRGSGLSINYLLLNVARIVDPAGDSE